MTGPLLFCCKHSKLIILAVLSSSYCLFDFDAIRHQKKNLKILLEIFVFLVPVEFLSHYPNIDNSNLPKENVHWIED